MTTKHEISATVDAQNWLSTLPREIQIKTLSTQILKEHWLTKNSSADIKIIKFKLITLKSF